MGYHRGGPEVLWGTKALAAATLAILILGQGTYATEVAIRMTSHLPNFGGVQIRMIKFVGSTGLFYFLILKEIVFCPLKTLTTTHMLIEI
ncbi:unnamed protein product [Callosobruchus maculatus]|uniref:Uncharacterized protein n=2 Tax=Callosobruchus maculatus TaxID=64391 RepID=A0A653BQ85_CALMS|nr:unnamed protein product [Callosobruchus maculatus]